MERKPLCLVIGLPFSSYIVDSLETPCASMHTRDSHWFRPMESPAKTIRRPRLRSRKSLASNLRNFWGNLKQLDIVFGIRDSKVF